MIYDTFLVEPFGTNATHFCSVNKLLTSVLVFLVPKMVHLHNKQKQIPT